MPIFIGQRVYNFYRSKEYSGPYESSHSNSGSTFLFVEDIEINYKICYRPGRDNQVADALSWIEPNLVFSSSLMILSTLVFDFRSQLQQENVHDPKLQRLHQEFSSNPTTFFDFTVVDGLLFHHGQL